METIDRGDGRRYFSTIPHMIDDMGLSPFAVRLYLHLKRRAGDAGVCFEGSRSMGDICKMSVGAVSNAKKELEAAGLIDIEREPGSDRADRIRIVDVWPANMAHYAPKRADPVHTVNTPRSPHEHPVHLVNTPVHTVNTPVHLVNTEEEPFKEKPCKENPEEAFGSGKPSPEKAGKAATATRIPEGWWPDESLEAWTRRECPAVDVVREAPKFLDYWSAQPGVKGRKTDWGATWRNWARRVQESATNRAGGQLRQSAGVSRAQIEADRITQINLRAAGLSEGDE